MFNPLEPWNAWFALSAQAMRMCWDAQAVMLLRTLRIAKGGARAEAETQRMITERLRHLLKLSSRQRPLRSRAARNIASPRKRWPSTRRESAVTGEGYRNSAPSDKAGELSVSGVNRTSVRHCEMSAYDPKRTLGHRAIAGQWIAGTP